MKKRMLIISFSPLERDPRVYRQINTFKKEYQVTTLGYSSSNIEGVEHYTSNVKRVSFFSRVRYKLTKNYLLKREKYEKYYWINPVVKDSYKKLKDKEFDIIIANDLNTLPIALRIKKKAKIIFDAHEYFPRLNENDEEWIKLIQPYVKYMCSNYMKQADQVITVSEGISREYMKEFGLEKPIVVTNASEEVELNPSKTKKVIRLIHHGLANRARKIEEMIEAMDYVDERFKLTLMLVPSSLSYYNELIEMAKKRDNVEIIQPVKMHEIISFTNQYDIGISIFPPSTFNLKHALPNKFFEFIQARLMILIGPSEEMANYVKKYKLGKITKDFSATSIAEVLNSLEEEEIKIFKNNSSTAAKKLNAKNNQKKLIQIVTETLEGK